MEESKERMGLEYTNLQMNKVRIFRKGSRVMLDSEAEKGVAVDRKLQRCRACLRKLCGFSLSQSLLGVMVQIYSILPRLQF